MGCLYIFPGMGPLISSIEMRAACQSEISLQLPLCSSDVGLSDCASPTLQVCARSAVASTDVAAEQSPPRGPGNAPSEESISNITLLALLHMQRLGLLLEYTTCWLGS